jgi:hypothetical protein
MHKFILSTVVVLSMLGCAAQSERSAEYVTSKGERLVISTQAYGSSGPVHLFVNGEAVASSYANSERGRSGTGTYRGQVFSFHCSNEADCLVFAGGRQIASLEHN